MIQIESACNNVHLAFLVFFVHNTCILTLVLYSWQFWTLRLVYRLYVNTQKNREIIESNQTKPIKIWKLQTRFYSVCSWEIMKCVNMMYELYITKKKHYIIIYVSCRCWICGALLLIICIFCQSSNVFNIIVYTNTCWPSISPREISSISFLEKIEPFHFMHATNYKCVGS